MQRRVHWWCGYNVHIHLRILSMCLGLTLRIAWISKWQKRKLFVLSTSNSHGFNILNNCPSSCYKYFNIAKLASVLRMSDDLVVLLPNRQV